MLTQLADAPLLGMVRPRVPRASWTWITSTDEQSLHRKRPQLGAGALAKRLPSHYFSTKGGTREVLDVVLVDDDDLYREVLSADLVDRGLSVSSFAEGPSFLRALSNGLEAKVGLVEWALPQMSGLDLLGTLKERGIGLPVVFLTGYSAAERELQALNHGAIDFVDKSRGADVLTRRLQVIIKSQRQLASVSPPQAQVEPQVEVYGELALHRGTARVLWRGRDVGLTVSEYKVLTLLVSETTPQTYRAIYDAVHFAGFVAGAGEQFTINVRSFMQRIRQKFVAVDPDFAAIKNVRLVGYRWLVPTPLITRP